ncbi:MAG TPA: hypothetical protein VGD14_16565 [bacterium]
MNDKVQNLFTGLADKFTAYLPNLLAGIVLVLVGWALGWFVKRVIVQFSVILRLERFLIRSRWSQDFSKGDVRYGFYNFLGNIGFLIVFLILLSAALSAWKLNILSDLLGKGIVFLPRIIIALLIFGIGWLIAASVEKATLKALRREDIPRSSLISRFINAVMLVFFSAMALVELNIARQIVIIGFSTIIITLGALTVVLTLVSGKDFVKKIQNSLEEE